MVYFVIRPVFVFPYLMFYSDGWLRNLYPKYNMAILYVFSVVFVWYYSSWAPALLYRITQVFPGTTFYKVFNTWKRYMVLHVGVLVVAEVIATIPYVGFLIEPYNSTLAIASIIAVEPVYANFSHLDPPILIAGCDFESQCQIFLKIYPFCIVFLVVSLGLVVWIGMPIYMRKVKSLKQATSNKRITQLNLSLFYALMIQINIIQFTWVNLLWIIAGMVLFRVKYGSTIAQIYSFIPMFYPLFEICALMYLVKPYRVYLKKLFEKWTRRTSVVSIRSMPTLTGTILIFNQMEKRIN